MQLSRHLLGPRSAHRGWTQRAFLKCRDVQGVVAGGLSPDFLISFSVVIVVVPPGVAIFVSCFAVDLVVFVQPVIPIEAMPIINVATTMRFIWNTFHEVLFSICLLHEKQDTLLV